MFVAIEVSSKDVLNSIHKIQTELNIKAKSVELHNMHFTVQFLGEVSEEMIGKISDALNSIEFSAFSITFASIGVFPKPNSPRVIWIGVTDGINELEKLAEIIRSKLSDIGFSPDKKFKPHVTIFRVKNKIEDMSDKLENFRHIILGSKQSQKLN